MAGESFQSCTVQVTGKCICETFPPSLHDLIIRPYVKKSPPPPPPLLPRPHKFAQKSLFPHEKLFCEKKGSPLLLGGGDALSSYALASFLTTMVQTMAFQSKTT